MRLDVGQSSHPPTKKQKIVEESEKVSSRVAKSKKQSNKLSEDKNLAGPSIDLSEPRVSLDKDKAVPNVEMRDADKSSAASKEKLSLSTSDLDEIKSYVRIYVTQYPVHKSEKGNPYIEEDPPQSLNAQTTDAKSYNVVDTTVENSYADKLQEDDRHSTDAEVDEAIKKKRVTESEEALHNTDEDLSKAITLYVPPSRAAYPTGINYIDAAAIDTCDRQGNINSQCYISDSAIAIISQVRECKTNLKYVRKLPSKRNRKGKDEYYTVKYADLKSSLDFVVAHPVKKIDFITWRNQVIVGMMRKKAKLDTTSEYRYTIVNCVVMNYIHDTYTHYHRSHSEIDLSSHVENVRSMKVALMERSICEIMQGLCIPAGIPWHLIDEVYADEIKELAEMLSTYLTISDFFEKKDRTDWSLLDAYKEKSDQHAFDVHIVDGIVQQSSGTLDCGLFVAAYAEFLSDRHQISSSEFDSKKHRTRYTSLLWD
ncbi:hypothetical protein T459_08776 [Capsicum annuum]|uniref:Ubiquitin-like protease family profile domain-containing protein n=1 Tax=Capsicum annuum TaxID=4072 RepID=A0A2G2ZXF4_CAPAN|nr:hypothetical protein T459_08776 [Capsicum annuum]